MYEQKVTIHLFDKDKKRIGDLTIIVDHHKFFNSDFSTEKMDFSNVPKVEEPDDKTPIQYCASKNIEPGARIMLLEETNYQILFETDLDIDDDPKNFQIIGNDYKKDTHTFEPWKLPINKEKIFGAGGNLNFHSYVGKSFFNVKIGKFQSKAHPFEVRSKKIGYREQYPQMIADLSKASSGLIFEKIAPLYQIFDFKDERRDTYNEDFIFLEYIFRHEILLQAYEYLRRNLYNSLEKQMETIPSSFARSLSPSDLVNMVSNPENLHYSAIPPNNWPKEMKNYVPYIIDQEICNETIDTPENRLVKDFLFSIDHLITDLDKNAPNGYIKDKIKDFKSIIKDYLSDSWLQDVGSLKFMPLNSQVLQKKEGYRDIFQYYLNFEFTFRYQWKEINDLLHGYNRRLSELYEYWCFFKLIDVLNNMTEAKKDHSNMFELAENKWSIKLKRGKKSIQKYNLKIDGHEFYIELMYNKLFSRRTEYSSYSLPFKPDYTLFLKTEDYNCFIHFDAKYRSEGKILEFYQRIGSEPLMQDILKEERDEKRVEKRDNEEQTYKKFKEGDIYKMHTYKDAILRTQGAYIFYPGDAKSLFKINEDEEIPSVGAFPLTPGKGGKEDIELEEFIRAVLRKILRNNVSINTGVT